MSAHCCHQRRFDNSLTLVPFQKDWAGSRFRPCGYRLPLGIETESSQSITVALAPGHRRDAGLLAVLPLRLRWLLGRRLTGLVADCGFTRQALIVTLQASGVLFIHGFVRSAPVRRRSATLIAQ